ncbi:MAG: helix-turn-helix transcriptional regulator [Nitrospira sp.]|nr:helix-turn-helix transcriptional regulator [Nitrospira sp.]
MNWRWGTPRENGGYRRATAARTAIMMATHIRQIRQGRGLTLQRLADLVGTTPQTIQRLEPTI